MSGMNLCKCIYCGCDLGLKFSPETPALKTWSLAHGPVGARATGCECLTIIDLCKKMDPCYIFSDVEATLATNNLLGNYLPISWNPIL